MLSVFTQGRTAFISSTKKPIVPGVKVPILNTPLKRMRSTLKCNTTALSKTNYHRKHVKWMRVYVNSKNTCFDIDIDGNLQTKRYLCQNMLYGT